MPEREVYDRVTRVSHVRIHRVRYDYARKKRTVSIRLFDILGTRSRIIVAWPGPNGSTFFLRNKTQRPLTPQLPSGSRHDDVLPAE